MTMTEHNHDEIEKGIAEALKPMDRPRVGVAKPGAFPQPVADREPDRPPYEPVRTITQFLVDIEKICDRNAIKQEDMEKNLAAILGSINDRLGLVLDRIGVLENMLGVR